jgi:hypothetical protein
MLTQKAAISRFNQVSELMMEIIRDNFGDNCQAVITSDTAILEQIQKFSTLHLHELT